MMCFGTFTQASMNTETMKLNHHRNKLENITFSTKRSDAWLKAIKRFYQSYEWKERTIQDGIQLNIFRRNERILNANIYHTGTIMFQGKEVNFVVNDFKYLKKLVDDHDNH